MKRTVYYILFIVLFGAGLLFFSKKPMTPIAPSNHEVPKTKVINDGNQGVVISKAVVEPKIPPAQDSNAFQKEFEKCFNLNTKLQSLDELKSYLLQQNHFSDPIVNQESYELVTANQDNLVVQYLPQEENSKIVRVFKINRDDGLPDRVKDFPSHSSEVSLRLKGALSLGSLQSKTVSTTQTNNDGSMLNLDEIDMHVVGARFTGPTFEFECKLLSCRCIKK